MSLKQYILLLALFGSAWCSTNPLAPPDDEDPDHEQVPSFVWMENDGVAETEILNITYPDGSVDLAILEQSDPIPAQDNETVDNCLFQGKLEKEHNVSVSLKRCPGENNFLIDFDSSKLENHIFSVTNGVVKALSDPDGDLTQDAEDVSGLSERSFGTGFDDPCPLMPNFMSMNVYITYDNEWLKKYGSNSVNQLNNIFDRAKGMFYLSSLTTRINMTLVGHRHLDANLVAVRSLNYVKHVSRSIGTDAHVYMYLSIYTSGGISERTATIGGVCSNDKGQRSAILEAINTDEDRNTARRFARQVGHLLGMYDDSSPLGQKTCKNEQGIMDYQSSYAIQWTSCSVQDLKAYYKNVRAATYGRFCLIPYTTCCDRSIYCYYAYLDLCGTYQSIRAFTCRKACGTCS